MPQFLPHDGINLAYAKQPGQTPGVMFLGGYYSDMTGTKAQFLAAQCAQADRAFIRFDYRGHGQSGGRFRDGCIGDWFGDALAILDQRTAGPQLLVGSSMGGWLALKLALARPGRVCGVIGLAAAPDFTEDLVWNLLSAEDKAKLERDGFISDAGAEPLIYTLKLVQEGRQHLLLRQDITLACPVHLLQGQMDDAVPWQTAVRIKQAIKGAPVTLTLIPDGNHRLSREEDCSLLWQSVSAMLQSL